MSNDIYFQDGTRVRWWKWDAYLGKVTEGVDDLKLSKIQFRDYHRSSREQQETELSEEKFWVTRERAMYFSGKERKSLKKKRYWIESWVALKPR